jgi:CHASE3 domain sensor protein
LETDVTSPNLDGIAQGQPSPLPHRQTSNQSANRNVVGSRYGRAGTTVAVAVAVAVAVTVAVVAVVFGFILPMNAADRSAVNWVEHTHEVIEATDQILMTVEDLETGQRGFLLTADTTYLEPYNEGIKSIWYQYFAARDITTDSPRQQTNLQNLADLLRNKMAVIDQTITLARGGDIDGSIDLVRTGEGKRLMNEIRATIGDLIAEEKRLLQERRDQGSDCNDSRPGS